MIFENIFKLPTPCKISFWWNFGSMLGLFLVVQVVSGFILACNYVCSFESVDLIIRDVWMGWLMRLVHANGASLFFLFLYLHMGRGIYYFKFFKNKLAWMVGVLLYILSMAIAFLGYVLPWGKMSYWGATVITNLVSVIPFMGNIIVVWLWGGFAVNFSTLTRFFAFHYMVPFMLIFFIFIHMICFHLDGSGNPLGLNSNKDKMSFFPYYGVKDLLGFCLSLLLLFIVVLIFPYIFMDCDKFIQANSLVTPVHIQPEWYFLPAYAVLRSIPKKFGGVVFLFLFILVLFFLPLFQPSNYFVFNTLMNKFLFWVWISMIMILLFMGAKPVEYPFETVGQISTFFYFFLYFRVFFK